MDLGQALSDLYPTLVRFALSLTKAKDAAEELVMEVITNMLERQTQFDDSINIQAYAMRSVKNKFIDSKRYSTRNLTATDMDGDGDFIGEILDGTAGNKAFDRIEFEETLKALVSLGEDCREILTLIGLEYRYNEIAEISSINIGTVMSRLSRCRKKLKEAKGESS